MPFDALAINVMVASPSDVPAERAMVANITQEWNAINAIDRQTVLLPLGCPLKILRGTSKAMETFPLK